MASDYQNRVLADGAVAYWPLDDPAGSTTARDLLGLLPAPIQGNIALDQPGILTSRCMVFSDDGSGQLPLNTLPSLGTAFTLEVWVNPTAAIVPMHRGLIVREIYIDGDYQWYVKQSTQLLHFQYFHDVYQTFEPTITITAGAWMHIVVTGGTGLLTFYVNGVAVQAPAAISMSGAGAGPAALLAIHGGTNGGWQGGVQDLAIYQRALSAQEVTDHYTLRTALPASSDFSLVQTFDDIFFAATLAEHSHALALDQVLEGTSLSARLEHEARPALNQALGEAKLSSVLTLDGIPNVIVLEPRIYNLTGPVRDSGGAILCFVGPPLKSVEWRMVQGAGTLTPFTTYTDKLGRATCRLDVGNLGPQRTQVVVGVAYVP